MSRAPSFPDDPQQQVRIPADLLKPVLVKLLTKRSVFQYDANTIVERMLDADRRGLSAYGCARVVDVLVAIDAGDVDPRGRVLTVTETAAIAVLDGSRAAGAVAGTKGVEIAMAKAREVGVGVVVVGNSQPLGAAGVYAQLAAQAGLIGQCITSTGKASVTAPSGGSTLIGNTAMAWAIPTGEGTLPIVFDTALGRSSWGKLAWLRKYGIPIPDEILANSAGEPAELASASLLPAGGALGFGLSLIASTLAGPLVGGKSPLRKQRTNTADDSQHYVQVIDIARFVDIQRFYKEVHATLTEMRSRGGGTQSVHIPGDSAPRELQRSDGEGIRLHHSDLEALRQWGSKLKVDLPF